MNKNSQYVKNSVENLRDYAKLRGLKLVFRNSPTNTGDFCFFIYKRNIIKNHYLIGYDGYWNAPSLDNTNFDRCWDKVHKFISNF